MVRGERYAEGLDLFTTADEGGALDSAQIVQVAMNVREALE